MSLKRELGNSEGREGKKTKTNDIRSLRGMDIEKVVGSGTFGVVFKATIKETGERVALKKFKLEIDPQSQGFPMQALREIRILKAVKLKNHVNIVKLFTMVTYVPEDDDEKDGVSRQTTHGFAPGDVFMVFEYVDYDLSGLLKCRDVALTEMHIRSYTKQLLEGVNFLHTNKILHRDIKGPNILVTRENVIKIADLGLARSYRTLDQKFTNSNSVVTLWYRSPELLLGTRSYGPEVDIWSVGCLYGEMKVRDAILKGTTEAEQLELIYKLFGTPSGEIEEAFSKLPESASEKMQFRSVYTNRVKRDPRFSRFNDLSLALFNKLLDVNPKTRITSQRALDDDYFWSGDTIPRAEDLPRFNVAVATDMSETERMKAERAAKIALEEERIKLEKERDATIGPGSLAGRGRLGGRGLMGRGRQVVGTSKYAVSKPLAGRGPGSLAGAAVPAGSIGAAAAAAAAAVKPAAGALFSPSAPSSSAVSSKQQGGGGAVVAAVSSAGLTGKVGADISPASSQPTASRNGIAPDPGRASDHSGDQGGPDTARTDALKKPSVVPGKVTDDGFTASAPAAVSAGARGAVSNSTADAESSTLATHGLEPTTVHDTTDPKQKGRWSPCD